VGLLRDGGASPLSTSATVTGSKVVFPVFKSTMMGADESGHARQRDGVEDPECSRASSGVC
jgi:hypothetical protein